MRTGIVIGSYGQPDFLDLNLAAIRHHCGDVPVLVCDDWPDWPGVDGVHVSRTPERLGHYGGDLRAFRDGIAWAAASGVDVLFKLSQRCIIDLPRWDRTWGQWIYDADVATLGVGCAFHGFELRTEAVGMLVAKWLPVADRLKLDGRMPEMIVADVARSLGPTLPWRMLAPARPTKATHVLFREANGPAEYAALAARLELEPGDYDTRESKAMDGYLCGERG